MFNLQVVKEPEGTDFEAAQGSKMKIVRKEFLLRCCNENQLIDLSPFKMESYRAMFERLLEEGKSKDLKISALDKKLKLCETLIWTLEQKPEGSCDFF